MAFLGITIGSHSRAMRTQISDPDCPFWGSFLVPCSGPELNGAEEFFFPISFDYQPTTAVLAVYHRPTTICLSQGGVLCTFVLFSCQCRGHPVALKLTASNMSAPLYS